MMNEVENTVSGSLYVESYTVTLEVRCAIWADPGSSPIDTTADPNGGAFSCDFDTVGWNLQPGDPVAISYFDPEGNQVTNIPTWPWMRVNYAHDWVGANYPEGHTFIYTVTDSLGVLKASGTSHTESNGGWGGDGFQSELWNPDPPDIQPYDWVFLRADDGYTNTLQVGQISGILDVAADTITGYVIAPSFGISLTVECYPWGAWMLGMDAEIKNSSASPNGLVPYYCEWDPDTDWDIQQGQYLGVSYLEPDGDRVFNAFIDYFKTFFPLAIR
jgi:hypothetical protein